MIHHRTSTKRNTRSDRQRRERAQSLHVNVDGSNVDSPHVLLLAVLDKTCRRLPNKERQHDCAT